MDIDPWMHEWRRAIHLLRSSHSVAQAAQALVRPQR